MDSHPGSGDTQVAALKELWSQYRIQKEKHQEGRDKTRALSRQIGEAKRQNLPVDELTASMRERTAEANAISEQLNDIENRILGFFTPRYEPSSAETPSEADFQPRLYPLSSEGPLTTNIHLLTDEFTDWNRYVSANPSTSIYHRAEWRALIENTFGHESFYFFARGSDGTIAGILPLIRLNSRLFGDFLVSMPYFNYGGAVADNPSIEQQLMEAAGDLAGKLGVSHIEYRDNVPRHGLPVRSEKVNMVLPLPGDPEELWQGFTAKLRAQIKRPQREPVSILCGGEEYLDDFYAVFARNMRDLGTPVYAKEFFRNILGTFPDTSSMVVLRMEGRPVAAGFLIGHRDTLEIPWASTIKDVNHLSMNMLLYWEILKLAISRKYRFFDFGRSSRDSGTFRFKKQWGALPRQTYWHYWLNSGEKLPALNPDNPKYALAINIWRRLPLPVTRLLGPSIVKYLP